MLKNKFNLFNKKERYIIEKTKMDFTDFLKMMGVKQETCFKKSDHCNCIFASICLKGQGGFDKIAGSSISHLCETCFITID